MKKWAIKIAVVILAAVLTMCFAGCGEAKEGADGKSAYEIWKEYHPESDMTEEEWANSLTGTDGESDTDGESGTDSKSAYEIWKENGHEGGTEAEFLEWLKGPQEQDSAGAGWAMGYGEPKEEGKKGEFYLDRERFDVYWFGDAGWEYVANLKGKETYDLGTYTFGGEDSVSVKLPDDLEEEKAYEVIITSKEDVSFVVTTGRREEGTSRFSTSRSKTRDEAAGITKNVAVMISRGTVIEEGIMQIVRHKDEMPTEIQVKLREYDEVPRFRADGEWHTIPLLSDSSGNYPLAMAVGPWLAGRRVKVTERSFLFETEDPQTFLLRFEAYLGHNTTATCLRSQRLSSSSSVVVMPESPEYRNRSLYFDIPSDCKEISLKGYGIDGGWANNGQGCGYFAQVKIEEIDLLNDGQLSKVISDEAAGEGTEESPYLLADIEGRWRINIPAETTVYVQTEIEGYNEAYIFRSSDDVGFFSKDFRNARGGAYSPPLGMEAGESVYLHPLKGKAGFEITNRESKTITVTLTIVRNCECKPIV